MMYFNEKENTNIDDQFKKSKTKLNINPKVLGFIIGGIVLVIIIVLIIFAVSNSKSYSIELYGEQSLTLLINTDYVELGYKALDKENNDITSQVKVKSNVDMSTVGEYEVLYELSGVSKVRYVKVVDGADETNLVLEGKLNMYLEIGEEYVEPGYIVFDNIDVDLTKNVKIVGNVDTSKTGVYQLVYSVTNSRNVTITKKRTVVVVEKGKLPSN